MFLNDAFDVDFDRNHRPERPIISGEVSQRFVWLAGESLLGLGWVCLLSCGLATAISGACLVATVWVYDAIHKKTSLAPLLMAGCRFLLYLVAGSAAALGVVAAAIWAGGALAVYIVGLSYVARRESTNHPPPRWPRPFLFIPIPIAFVFHRLAEPGLWLPSIVLVFWIAWCLRGRSISQKIPLPGGVSGLLAGIALVDWLAACSSGAIFGVAFIALFLLAILFQRVAPAT
jgi:4-hydroxybenzoate polyprenyltransferase